MQALKNRLIQGRATKKTYRFLKVIYFELCCIAIDLVTVLSRYSKSKRRGVKSSDILFVCSLSFYERKKWQVASQADLWHRFVAENNCVICGSFLSYWLLGRNKKYVVSLEPKYNAPTIKFSKNHVKTFLFVSDSHSKSWLPKYIENKNVTDILTPYKKTLLYTGFSKPLSHDRVHSLPWCVEDRLLVREQILSKDNRVLGFGQTGGLAYDLRSWSFQTGVLSSFNYAGSGNKKYSGDSYYNWLRRFDACVVAMSTHKLYNYTVAKFFEVTSQGLLLFAFKTDDLDDFGFIDGENYISVTKQNFFEKINDFKLNPEKYINIRRNGYFLIKNQHTVSKRLEQLAGYLEF
jgi:hypothetical protein